MTGNAVENGNSLSEEIRQLAIEVAAGSSEAEILRQKRAEVLSARAWLNCGRSVIFKMWNDSGPRASIRRMAGRSRSQCEWRALNVLYRRQVRVPEPLAWITLPAGAEYRDAVCTADLGPVEIGSNHLIALLAQGAKGDARRFEDRVIELTNDFIDAGILDLDHTLTNVVVPANESPVRVDLELTVPTTFPGLHTEAYAKMIAKLVGTLTYAVQPDLGRVGDFASRLSQRVSPPISVLQRARAIINEMMEGQIHQSGVESRVELPW